MKAELIVTALAEELKSLPEEVAEPWTRTLSHRTHIMTGKAVRRGPSTCNAKEDSVLHKVVEEHLRSADGSWLFPYFEGHGIDLVCFEVPSDGSEARVRSDAARRRWDVACWGIPYVQDEKERVIAQYRNALVLEVENDLQEFEMTVRWMMDIRAPLYCAIFYCNASEDLDEIQIGVSRKQRAPLRGWVPPWAHERGAWQLQVEDGTELVAVFLDEQRPSVVGARTWSCHAGESTVRDLHPCS